MDQQFIEREKELFKLNAKLNAKSKKIQATAASNKLQGKPVQIHTSNNYFNYYDEQSCTSSSLHKEAQDDGLELMCKKISMSPQPIKKPQEIVYPFFNRQTPKPPIRTNLDIHMPTGSMISDGNAEQTQEVKSESMSFKNESMITRYSDDSSAIPSANLQSISPTQPPPLLELTEIIPKSMEKKNISNDGLLKFLKSKVALLQSELEVSKSLNDTLERENAKNVKKIKKLNTQVTKSASKIESLETTLRNIQEKQEVAEQNLKEKDSTNSELNKDLLALKEEAKEVNHEKQIIEKRLLKVQEDYEMMKTKFETFKEIDIIMRETVKEEKIAYEEKISKLRKGRMDMLKAYKQQIILIDNLRRQNICLEKTKALEITEKEFLKVLDWNFSDK
ncbi:CLUMA_CG016634, isoform A [Clunio marinus]|uniref:CLUMA_CG016634, isoform A n=1 Tax=Clunio marinus TaxID=568069 RepID=A0A1J1ITL5_9DIPT|nr:CLUMA_CG016634, isoform A [Clunio marinus]